MIARYLFRRTVGALMRLGRTLRGQERPRTPGTHMDMDGTVLGPKTGAQEVGS